MSEAWLEIGRIKPQPRPYRTICSVPGCDMNERPADFAMRDTAEAWARNHADYNGHVVLIQELRDEQKDTATKLLTAYLRWQESIDIKFQRGPIRATPRARGSFAWTTSRRGFRSSKSAT